MPNLSEHSIFLTNNMIYHQHRKQALKVLFCFFHLQCLISPPILFANKKSVLQDSGETSNSRIDRFRIHSETLSSTYTLKGRSCAGPSGQKQMACIWEIQETFAAVWSRGKGDLILPSICARGLSGRYQASRRLSIYCRRAFR